MKDLSHTVAQAADLITDMVMELHFRGCEDAHPLIRRAGDLRPKLKKLEKVQASQTDKGSANAPGPSRKLYLMTAEDVSVMDLEEKLTRGDITGPDLAEAAFTFENELMAILGDDNAMPMDAYSGMDEQGLIKVIRSAVDNICRLRVS